MISVILPVYNEARVIEKSIIGLERILSQKLQDFEIIISEDGSTDGTAEIAKKLENERIRLIRHGKRMGKGGSIKRSTKEAAGDIVIFMDADLASNPESVDILISMLQSGADIVVGSRYLKESKAKRNLLRFFASKGFNWLVGLMLGSRLTDHQCGFKAFRKESILPIFDEIENHGWFWDTELLVRAQRRGLKVVEIPVEWKESPYSKYRLLRDSYHMARNLVRFKIKHG